MLLLSSEILSLLCGLHIKPSPPPYTLHYYHYHYLFIFWKNLRNCVFVMWWQRQTTRKALHVTEMDVLANGTKALHMTLSYFSQDSMRGIPDSWGHASLWWYLESTAWLFPPTHSRSKESSIFRCEYHRDSVRNFRVLSSAIKLYQPHLHFINKSQGASSILSSNANQGSDDLHPLSCSIHLFGPY